MRLERAMVNQQQNSSPESNFINLQNVHNLANLSAVISTPLWLGVQTVRVCIRVCVNCYFLSVSHPLGS